MRLLIFSSIFLGLFFMTNAFENLNFENEFGLNVKSFGDRLKRQNFQEYNKPKKFRINDAIEFWKSTVPILFKGTISNNLHPSIKRLFFQQNSSIQMIEQSNDDLNGTRSKYSSYDAREKKNLVSVTYGPLIMV